MPTETAIALDAHLRKGHVTVGVGAASLGRAVADTKAASAAQDMGCIMPKVEIYTRDWCGYCVRAKRLLSDKDLTFAEYNASSSSNYRAEMMQRSGRSTFPQVFIDGKHIGGSDDLAAFVRSGQLDALLKDA